MSADPMGFEPDVPIRCLDFSIGCVSAGFVMAEVQLGSSKPPIGRSTNGAPGRRRNSTCDPRSFKAMMQTGIFTTYFPYALQETARKIRALGFNTVQLGLRFKLRALGL